MITDLAVVERGPDHWAQRITFTVAVLVAFALLVWAARRAWLRRQAAHADLLPLPDPVDAEDLLEAADGLYVGTTEAGSWQARIHTRGLANRAGGTLHTTSAGVRVERDGSDPLFIPVGAIKQARLDAGHANKVVGGAGMLVVTWEHRGYTLESGFRPDRRLDGAAHAKAITTLEAAV